MASWKPTKRELLRASGVPDELLDAEWFTQPTGGRVPRRETADPVALMVVYVDTAQFNLPSMFASDRHDLDAAMNDLRWWCNPSKVDLGGQRVTVGHRLKVQLPHWRAADQIDRLLADWRGFGGDETGSLTRIDYSVDFLPLGGRSVDDVDRWVHAHLLFKGRRPGPLLRHKNTTYWNPGAHQRQHSRDIAHYSDKPPKHPVLGSSPITHLDIRLRGSQTFERLNLTSLSTVLTAKPADVISRMLHFTNVDIEPHARAEALAVGTRYADPVLREIYTTRHQLNFAQRVKDRCGIDMPPDPIPPLLIVPELLVS